MTDHQIQENFTFPQETYQAIGVTYYRKIPPRGTITGPIIVSAWVTVKTKYQLNSLFISNRAVSVGRLLRVDVWIYCL